MVQNLQDPCRQRTKQVCFPRRSKKQGTSWHLYFKVMNTKLSSSFNTYLGFEGGIAILLCHIFCCVHVHKRTIESVYMLNHHVWPNCCSLDLIISAKLQEFALKIINETHQSWRKLIMKEVENDKGLAW